MKQTIVLLILLIGVCALAAGEFEDYHQWKAERASRAQFNSRSNVGNDFVQVYCDDETGMFTIGTTDGQNLLYGFPEEGSTSHTNIKIDDTIYSNDWVSGTEDMPVGVTVIENNSIITTFNIEGIEVVQYLVPVQGDDAGAIWIYYEITNNTGVAHNIGALLELDTQIAYNDGAPLATSYGFVTVETGFNQPDMPAFWQAFESDDYDPDLLIGEGTLFGSNAIAPDVFIAGAWGNLVDVAWDYTASGDLYYDSAVIYRWDQVTVPAGSMRMVGTLYGTGEVSANQGELNLLLAAPTELINMGGFLAPNPFEVNLIVHNTTESTANNVNATIVLPDGLELAGGAATQPLVPSDIEAGLAGICSWSVWAEVPPNDITYTITVNVTSDNVEDNSISRDIFVPHFVGVDDDTAPAAVQLLEQNRPNPFNPSTTIVFNLPTPGMADILVYDMRGRLVRSFANVQAPDGRGEVIWNGDDNIGNPVSSGIYMYQLRSQGKTLETRRMALLK
ncbi:MAG: T9SS type A sorting domain-containing protein [Candidatus Cloacimonetes bacterium]|nr:T9SS type A sorting domain-containing protein [Candidatus Cloacimonadota bacterium]